MKAARIKLETKQYRTFKKRFRYLIDGAPVNLTGWTAKMQVRASATTSKVILEAATGGAGITLSSTGYIDIVKEIGDAAFGTHEYDIKLIEPDGESVDFADGTFVIEAAITR